MEHNRTIMKGREVVLAQMLDTREQRAFLQMKLLQTYQKPLLCFTMNIAGPIKNNALIHEGFRIGCQELKGQLLRIKAKILHEEVLEEVTGNELFLVLDGDPMQIKKAACELEDQDDLGRLYDMDVLYPEDGFPKKIDREEVGRSGRTCLLCGKPAKECSSRRIHTVPELQGRTLQILDEAVMEHIADTTAEHAVRALLYEVAVTPKPGLVDRDNSGSHKDMNFYTFLNSASVLYPYFHTCAALGWQEAGTDAAETFRRLRTPGKQAENRMLRATGGINTHKGAIFSLGILAAATGRVMARQCEGEEPSYSMDIHAVLEECAAMTSGIVERELVPLKEQDALTAGQKLYVHHGITGVRGMAEDGFPILEKALDLLKKQLGEGKNEDEAGWNVLLAVLSDTTDTNMISRSDVNTAENIREKLKERLTETTGMLSREELQTMDRQFMEQNLSPGGSADLLAMCWMLYFTEKGGYGNV